MPPTFACFDVETTSLDANAGHIIEIAVVRITAEGEVLSEWCSLVDAGTSIMGRPDIHGISVSMLTGAPTFAEIAGDLAELFNGCVPVAHNASFDVKFVSTEWERANLGPLPLDALDTLDMARRQGRPGRLGALAESLGVPLVDAHQALDDTRALAGVLVELLKDHEPSKPFPVFSPPLFTPVPTGKVWLRPSA